MTARSITHGPVALGLGVNLEQFSLLVLINAFVGGMVGLERTVLPLIAEREFGLASKSVAGEHKPRFRSPGPICYEQADALRSMARRVKDFDRYVSQI